jgi:hypothetical protein
MATNDYSISRADWDGPHGTGWNQDLAGQGLHGKRSFAQHRAAARIAQEQAAPYFSAEFRASEGGGTGFLSPKIARAWMR